MEPHVTHHNLSLEAQVSMVCNILKIKSMLQEEPDVPLPNCTEVMASNDTVHW